MREAQVQAALVTHLLDRGWDVTTESDDHIDIIARRGAEHLVIEVKGHTTSPGLDVDTAYGQLLRRMTAARDEATFILAVPESLATAAARVSPAVRRRLGIEIWLISDFGGVRQLDDA